ncbi:hypothetical protein BSZ39_02730 [Bowdeniella nasicola]|uniref:PemK-like, MazF-like toxin of type II toxin-antitoxin system n=1 Tax=Bowdeniella nasicola TaxID=208480 RepID=A0A1Q5Q4H1_9ACTO|nr:type II toxin-antitoxin system PemK/MazF family toxin [Bowdeniella nasicola]OKL54717.1 hypothetical protein BSZ39_02730 [Bowdeniella nasicola]
MSDIFSRSLRLVKYIARDAIKSKSLSYQVPQTEKSATIGEYDLTRGLPAFQYAPDPDGDADPGEVVRTWVPYEEDPSKGKDRPVLVLAHQVGQFVVAQLTSKDHDRDAEQEARYGRYWFDIGSGAWDKRGRPSEVRLDRLLWVVPEAIRREGGRLDKPVFDAVTAALIELHRA